MTTSHTTLLHKRPHTTHHTTMSWGCGAGNTRGTTLAAEKEAAAAGTQLDNATLINILMGRMTVDVNPSPRAADATWPDEEHIALARHAIENPFHVIPHPKNVDHPLCGECGIFAASTLVVPARLCVRECSLPCTANRAQRPTLKMNTFLKRQFADAEFRGLPGGSPALNASKQKMSRETVARRDAERIDMAVRHTANLAAV